MKYINGKYQLSKTDIKKAGSHTRAIARSHNGNYNGYVSCYFDIYTGKLIYEEFVGDGWLESSDSLKHIYSAPVRSWNE